MYTPYRRVYALACICLVLSLLLASCSSNQAPQAPTATPVVSGSTGGSAPTQPPTAVSPTTQSAPSTAAAKNPDTFIELGTGDAQTFDPAWLYDSNSWEVVFQVYENLLMLKRDSTSQYVPLLASKWDISPDGKTYTFTLRKGIKFEGGQDLTPEDVAYSVWRGVMQDRAGGPQWIMLQPLFGLDVQTFQDGVVAKQANKDWVAACEATKKTVTFDNSAGTVTFHLAQPYGPFLQILTGPWAAVVSKSWVAGQGGWDGDCKNAQKYHDPKAEEDQLFKVMNGTGPYKLQYWKPGEEIALTRNDNYWLKDPLWDGGPSGPAKVKNILLKIVPEWGTRFSAFKNGDADIAYVDQQYISQVDPMVRETCGADGKCTPTNANGTLRLYKGLPTTSANDVFLNQSVNTTGGSSRMGSGKLDGNGIPPDFFADIHVRKAFNYCFDWDTYLQQVLHGEAERTLGPIIDGEIGYDSSQAHYTFDLDKCAAEFKASTLKSADGKSLWDTGFSLQYVYDTGTDARKSVGEILKDGLQRVNPNFRLDIASEPWPAFLDELTAGRLPMYMVGWIEDFHDTHDWVFAYLASSGAYSGNQHFPKDLQDKMDSLITQAISSTDVQERTRIYKELQNDAYENALDIFLEQPQARRYEQLWVKGWYYNPTYPAIAGYPGTYYYALSKGQ